ncbi:Na+/proline symporter [Prauserella sp. Am3]|nr:Na+/proline symporter [Prauserella sp. Am3]
MDMSPWTLAAVAIYLAVVIGIGLLATRRVSSMRDYLVAGDGFGRWIVSFGIVGAIVSGAGILGNAGSGYGTGYAMYVMTMGLSFLGLTLAYFLLAKPLTVVARKHAVYTLPDLLALRYGDSSAVRLLSAVATALGCLIYLVVQFVAIGYIGTTIFGWSQGMSLLVGGGIVVVYCVGGGIVSAMWTNFFQLLVLSVVVVYFAIYTVSQVGGLTALHERMAQADPNLIQPWHDSGAFGWENVLVYAFFVGLLAYAGVPHISTKFLTIKNLNVIRWIPLISCFLYLFAVAATWVGMAYRVEAEAGRYPAVDQPDAVLPTLVAESFPPFVVGLMIAAVLAAVMSTTDSFMVLSGAAVVRDILKNSLGMRMSDRQELTWSRVVSVAMMVVAGLIALNPPTFVLSLMAVAWGALAAMLGPVLYLGVRWRRATPQGAIAALIVGLAIGGVLALLNETVFAGDPVFAPWNIASIGVAASYLALIVVSLWTKPVPSRMFEHFSGDTARQPAAGARAVSGS